MKSIRSSIVPEQKQHDISIGDLSRVKLPRLQKPGKKGKKPISKGNNRLDGTPSKYEQLVEEIMDLQSCVSKKYGKSIKIESLRKMQKSISSLNQDINTVNRNICVKSAKEPMIRSTSSSDTDDILTPVTDEVFNWSKRLFFRRRLEMANKNLIVINFEGVIGDIFKENIWQDQEEALHLRKGAKKALRHLLQSFQVVLFFHTSRVNYNKVLNYFSSKSINFDGAYCSENNARWATKCKGKFKKTLKYSEHMQNYSQISMDFGIQNEVLGKMLILTSIWLDHDEYFAAGLNLIIKNFQSIPQYLCKAVPVSNNPDTLLPITLALPDPRIANEGDSMMDVVKFIVALAEFSPNCDECSWLDGFARIRAEPQLNTIAYESTAYQYALAREKVEVSRDQVESYVAKTVLRCACPNELKNNCKLAEFGSCSSYKKMRGYLIAGKDMPTSMTKNKFLIYKLHSPHPYKVIKNF